MFYSINGIKSHNLSNLWHLSENYLSVCKKDMDIHSVNDKVIKLKPSSEKPNWILTVLKIISYATIILPLIALIVKTVYRNQYKIEEVKPFVESDYELNAIIEKIKTAQAKGLKTALYVGRDDTQSLPKEKEWYWISLDRVMDVAFDPERPHLKMNFNDTSKMAKIKALFNKVVVDLSVIKFFENSPWNMLKPLLIKEPDSELIVEGHTGSVNMIPKDEPEFYPEQASYVAPLKDFSEFLDAEEAAFENWKLKTSNVSELYKQFLASKTAEEIAELRRMHSGSDFGLEFEFMRKILKENGLEPKQKSYDDEHYKRVKVYLEGLFRNVVLHKGSYPYESGWCKGKTRYFVCRNPI